MQIIEQSTKTLKTRDNGRSADAISPNLIYGCLGGCMKSYCYVGRFNPDKVYVNNNISEILDSIHKWVYEKEWPKIPNQCDDTQYVIDIGCSTDIALMQKYLVYPINRLQIVFDHFNVWDRVKSSFATKYPTRFDPTNYNLHSDKHRIRVSLMPQKYSDILEPKTDLIQDRIDSIPRLQQHMEVHINFSPIIYTQRWLEEYRNLFETMVKSGIKDVKCECIFLTYNDIQHKRNSDPVNDLCWKPQIQEKKDSQYAADNIRYKHDLKREMVKSFVSLYSEYYNPSNIRYIF